MISFQEELLFEAVKAGDAEMVTQLLANGANINAQEELNKNTPLMVAVITDSLPIVKLLVQLGADVNKTDNNGQTALIKAVIWNNPDYVRALLSKDSDLNAADNRGCTAGMYAGMMHNYEIQSLLERAAKKKSIQLNKECLLHNGFKGDDEAIACLGQLNEGSVQKLSAAVPMHIIEKVANIKAQADIADKSTLFKKWLEVVDTQNIEAMRYLTANQVVDVNIADGKGETALFKATISGDEKAVSMLLQLGANPDMPNNQGITPLMAASGLRLLPIVKEALPYSENIHLQDKKGRTALDYAKGDQEIISLFAAKLKARLIGTAEEIVPPLLIDKHSFTPFGQTAQAQKQAQR